MNGNEYGCNMQRERIRPITALVILSLFIFIITSFIKGGVGQAYAATSRYSDVLSDLTTDSDFDPSEYPTKADDYSINVIQIAESTGGELFVYTYQPCQKTKALTATQINMSLTDELGGEVIKTRSVGDDAVGGLIGGAIQDSIGGAIQDSTGDVDKPQLYSLTLLNSNGVFGKYKVNGFTVSNETVRYYNIVSIYREWIQGIDDETGNDNTKNAVAFAVGKCYAATTENGVVSYASKFVDTVEIVNPVAGYVEYSNGFKLCPDWCDSHYVAFSTDKKIDALMEADVFYVMRSASQSLGLGLSGNISYGEPESVIVPLDGTQTGGNVGDGWFGQYYKFEWNRIESIDTFMNEVGGVLSDEAKNKLDGAQWVLRFVETTRLVINGGMSTTMFWTDISEVSILRLKFVSDGVTYNLGAVSDKVTEGDSPDNPTIPIRNDLTFWKYVWNCIVRLFNGTATLTEQIVAVITLFIALLILPAILTILSLFFPAVRKFMKSALNSLWTFVKYLFIGIWYIITAPFRLIAWLIGRKKNDGGGSKTND